MRQWTIAASLALSALMPGTPPAAAQTPPPEIKVSAGKAFTHKHSKLALPATLGGLPRDKVVAFADEQLDVAAAYTTANNGEVLTIYITRQVTGAVPVWFDRARWGIENREDVYGTPVPAVGAPTFVPPGQSTASGLVAAYTLNKPPYRSTALAILPLGEWMVKARYSSTTMEAATLMTRLRTAVGELGWPRQVAQAPPVSPVAPCRTPLTFTGVSRPLGPDLGGAVFNGLLASAAMDKTIEKEAAPVTWCRDPVEAKGGSVYRPDESTESYLIALSDAGRGMVVRPSLTSTIVAERDKTRPAPRWSVAFVDVGRTLTFASQDRLPTPTQVLDSIVRGAPETTVATWGKKRSVEVNGNLVDAEPAAGATLPKR